MNSRIPTFILGYDNALERLKYSLKAIMLMVNTETVYRKSSKIRNTQGRIQEGSKYTVSEHLLFAESQMVLPLLAMMCKDTHRVLSTREALLSVGQVNFYQEYILPTLTNFWSPALHKGQATFNHQLFQRSELKKCGLKVQVMHHVSRLSGSGQSLQANKDTYIRQGIPEAQRSLPRTQRQSPNLFV